MNAHVPHLKVVVAFCIAALVGYSAFSVYVVVWMRDPALTGDVVGTWKSFAVGVFAFWVGSSSGSKAKDNPSGEPNKVEVVNEPNNPVPVRPDDPDEDK